MNRRYDEWMARAHEWRDELLRKLVAHGGADLVTPYANVALAFPSPAPNPRSFDTPLLDPLQLKAWAVQAGWDVSPAADMASADELPPVRFRKRSSGT